MFKRLKHRRTISNVLFIFVIITFILPATFCISLSIASPFTSIDAMEYIDEQGLPTENQTYTWTCPNATGYGSTQKTVELPITEEDFRESMDRDVMRRATVCYPVSSQLVDPDHPILQRLIQHILSVTEGYSDERRILAALWFVQSVTEYESDENLYGNDDFWATPIETLYLRAGDCEDLSALLATLTYGMGYETALLDYTGHLAVGVKPNADSPYIYCETTKSYTSVIIRTDLTYCGEYPDIYPIKPSLIRSQANDFFAYCRNRTKRTLSL